MNEHHHNSRSSFSGRIGYVLAVAGSAVGLGNIWRFPYLAAKYGGGMFLLVYLILMLTFGYTMIVSETALGRMTGKSPVGAFSVFGKTLSFRFGGWINAVIPILIVPYYSVIGGWVTKYLFEYLRGSTKSLASDDYFTGFIANGSSVELWFLVFTVAVILVVVAGVKAGVERISKIMMPVLVVLAVLVAVYSVTRPGALEGVKYFLIPDFEHFSWMTVVAAMGQMFYSLSIAMGILYTYGSYLNKDVDIEKSTTQVEWFDTAIAILAGLMIIPAVFAFSGGNPDTLQAGPSLMFITIPKVFASMGFGTVAGILFFLLVLFAALTSAISLAETSVSTFEDQLGWNRKKCTVLVAVIMIGLGSVSALGFSVLDFVKILGMSILDFFDFLTNSVMMPIAALATCVLIIRVVGFQAISREIKASSKFKREKMYRFFMKYLALLCIAVILISSIANVLGIISL
jgi:NSS family neurotransmitter:Na+ symporter